MTKVRLIAVLGAAVAGATTYALLTRAPPSAEELIKRKAIAMADAAQRKDVADVMKEVAPSFRSDEGMGRDEVRGVLAAQILRGEWVRVFTTGLEVSLTSPTTADFKGNYIFGRSEATDLKDLAKESVISAYEITARLQRESDGEWRFVWAKWRQVDATALF